MATLGGENISIVLPDGVDEDKVSVGTGPDGNNLVVVEKNVSGLEVTATTDTGITGKKITDTTVSVKGSRGETTNVVLETTVAKNTFIGNEGKGALEVNLNTGKVKNLTIDAGNKKRDDLVRVKDDVKLISSTMDMGKGDDTVRFGKGVTFKGQSTVDLGKGGADSIIIEADAVNKGGKLIVTSFSKQDTITVGDQTFTYKDIKNGAEIPNVKVELA